jgi:hypothetical protein
VKENTEIALGICECLDEVENECRKLQKELEDAKLREKDLLDNSHSLTMNYIPPTISYNDMTRNPDEVKRWTGFSSLAHLISYVMIICNGDQNKMIEKHTYLTWLEEWFFILSLFGGGH